MKSIALGLAFLLLAALFITGTAQAQTGTRTFVPSPQALGMGGAAVAVPSPHTALFYNPAHLSHIPQTGAPATMLGFSASLSNSFNQQRRFYNERLQPALEGGLDQLSDEERQALYAETFERGHLPALFSGEVLLPSFVLNRGSYGVGAGLFAHTEWIYNTYDSGDGVPGVDLTALADILAVAAGSVDLSSIGLKGLSAGVTAKYAQRFVTIKSKALDAIDYDHETFHLLGASAVAADLGVLYEASFIPGPGRFYLGASVSDLTLKGFDYKFAAYWENRQENREVRDEVAISREAAIAQARYQLHPTYRAGVSYVHPGLGGVLGKTTVALDYVSYAEQVDLPSHISLGVETELGSRLALRTGVQEGFTTIGAGLDLQFIHLDYAFYRSRAGIMTGQSIGEHHRIQVTLGL